VPAKKFEGQKPQILPICRPIFDILSPTIPSCKGNREIKNNSDSLWLGYDIYTKHGLGPTPMAKIGCCLGAWVGQIHIRNQHNFGCMTASDSVFDSRVSFAGQPIGRRHCRGQNCSTRATVQLAIGPHSSFFIETPRCTRPLRKECYGMVILEAGCL